MYIPKIQALVSCQDQVCAEEVSYTLDMVRKYQGKPICEECYKERSSWADPEWRRLEKIKFEDLRA